jgi:asparaginyl-tRNA synthetase
MMRALEATPDQHDYGAPPTLREVLARGEVGTVYTVAGWVRSYRASKNVSFIALNDGSILQNLQIVLNPEVTGLAEVASKLSTGASVRVRGALQASPAKGQRVELHASELELLGVADVDSYPLQKKGHTLEFLRSITHLRVRSNTFGAVYRIRSTLALATHEFFGSQGFQYVHTPIITASDCEGAGEMFEVVTKAKGQEFFGRPAMLTVSGQLNGEALAYGLGRIYTFGPTFRAENSNTVRHLSEFWMIEPEMAFFDLKANMRLAEAYLKATVRAALERNRDDIEFLAGHYDEALPKTLERVLADPFAHVTYTEAVRLLEKASTTFEFPVAWGNDLQAEHERYLVETHFGKPVIVTDYPRDLKSFYMYQNDDGKTVGAMDVLIPRIGEIIGGSQREHRLAQLEAGITARGMNAESYTWYLDLNRFGAVPHAGFGLGFERLVMFCTGMTNIRDVIPFPRAPGLAAY